MKIGVNARTFLTDEPDGAVQTARNLTRRLGTFDDVELILFGNSRLEEEFPECKRVSSTGFVSNSPFFGVVWERTILPILVNRVSVDILICPNGNAPATPVDCPVITYIHDVNAQMGMSSDIHEVYRKFAVPIGVRNSDAVITVSKFSKQEILKQLNISEDNIHVIYNGVDDFYLQPGGCEPVDVPENYILYVGAMNPRKNVSNLVKAYKQIQNKISHKLVLIGPENKSVYQKLDIDSSTEDIITPGFIPMPQLKYAYKSADLFAYPSLYEGFGLPPLEAIACGTPVIASKKSSLPEILDDAAMYFSSPQNPKAIATDLQEGLKVSESSNINVGKGETRAHEFTWSHATKELYSICKSLIGTPV